MASKSAALETWRNTAKGFRWFIDFGVRGEEVTRIVRSGEQFTVTPMARKHNQERSVPKLDLFTNGDFVLIRESAETDVDDVKSPDAMSDVDIADVLRRVGDGEKLLDLLDGVTSYNTLLRVLEAAEESDLHHAKYRSLRERVAEMSPVAEATQKILDGRDPLIDAAPDIPRV